MAMSLARTLSSIEMKDLVIKASQHQDDLAEMEEAQGKRRHKNTMSNTVVSKSKDSEDAVDSPLSKSVAGGSMANNLEPLKSEIECIKLNDVLGQSESFDAFALHVAKEISIEMLVSYCEVEWFVQYVHLGMRFYYEFRLVNTVQFTQLLQYLFDNYEDMIDEEVKTKEVREMLADLPATVPQSYILRTATGGEGVRVQHLRKSSRIEKPVSSKTEQEVLMLVLFMGSSLYNKYVKKNADLEINISAALRKKFTDMFTGWNNQQEAVDLDLNAVINLFVEGEKAMHTLLSYSFTRFKMKRDFERMLASSFSYDRSQHRTSIVAAF